MSCRVTRGHSRVTAVTASAKARGDFLRKAEQQRGGVRPQAGLNVESDGESQLRRRGGIRQQPGGQLMTQDGESFFGGRCG